MSEDTNVVSHPSSPSIEDVVAERDALLAYIRHGNSDFDLSTIVDDILIDRSGKVVYRPLSSVVGTAEDDGAGGEGTPATSPPKPEPTTASVLQRLVSGTPVPATPTPKPISEEVGTIAIDDWEKRRGELYERAVGNGDGMIRTG